MAISWLTGARLELRSWPGGSSVRTLADGKMRSEMRILKAMLNLAVWEEKKLAGRRGLEGCLVPRLLRWKARAGSPRP